MLIPAGTKGELRITRLGGVQGDLVMDTRAQLLLANGKRIELVHYKAARENSRTALKLAKTATMFTPMGAAGKDASVAYKRGTNKYNLPLKMFTARNTSI